MDFREALQAGKIGIGGAYDHWTRLFGQKVLGGYAEGYAEGAIASFTDGVNAPVDKLLVAINPVQSGTGDPSPENIRPISGWTGAQVTRCGENLCNPATIIIGSYVRAGNTSESRPLGEQAESSQWNCSDFIRVNPSTQYTTSVPYYSSASAAGLVFFDSFKSAISGIPTVSQRDRIFTFTTPSNCSYLRFSWNYLNGTNVQLAVGTDSSYTPYTGTTYPITFPSEAGTVYGGELDVKSGVLRVTDANIASYAGETINEPWISSMDVYSAGATPTTGAQVVYKLATPLTYQLTPTEVTTLLGVNNIWADTGDVKVWYKKKK